MPKIKIAHLYYDLMNLYGENANIRALVHFAERQGIKAEVSTLTICDEIDFSKYDIFYIGSGTEKSELLVLSDMMKYKSDIKDAIEGGKTFISTGNSIELFGEEIIDKENVPALNIFPYTSKHEDFRIVGSIVFKTKLIKEKIVGFQNRCGVILNTDKPLFKVIEGTGSTIGSSVEGYTYKNFYGTYAFGPLLIRNPYFTNYILKNVMKSKNKKYKFKVLNNISEIKAYNKYLENFKIK